MKQSMSDPGGNLSIETGTPEHHQKGSNMAMLEQITIVIPGTPVAKARPRFTRTGHVYTPAATKQAEDAIKLAWIKAAGNRAPHPGPVHVRAQFVFEPPKSWTKTKRTLALEGRHPHMSKPDIDNLLKIIDGLNGRAWIDDAQITNVAGRKDYGTEALSRFILTFHPATSTTETK